MQRFFVQTNQVNIENKLIQILGEDVNHIKNVLRCKIGEQIEVCDKELNQAYLCGIIDISDENIKCKINEVIDINKEADLYINIVQGLPKSEKMELIIQKCTELGVKEFTPIALKRCVVKIDKKDEPKKVTRWIKQAEAAAKQSGRNMIPVVNNIQDINSICDLLKDYDLILLAYENERKNILRDEIKKIKSKNVKIAIIIGPEGGLEEIEVNKLKGNGAKVVSLGNRILRTETVALVMSSILMYELGDLG